MTVLTNCKLYLAGRDLSGYLNALGLEYGAEPQDDTVFGDDTRSMVGGLKTVSMAHEGLWDETPDEDLFGAIGVVDKPVTIGPLTGAAGEVGYINRVLTASYQPGAEIGQLLKFSVAMQATDKLVRGTILHNTAQTSSGDGTGYQVGAVGAGQSLYAALHVYAASGTSPTLDVIVQSDDNGGFSSPTSRITFTQATDRTSEWATPVAGAITDDYWRVNFTIGGTGPSFSFIVTIGIL